MIRREVRIGEKSGWASHIEPLGAPDQGDLPRWIPCIVNERRGADFDGMSGGLYCMATSSLARAGQI